MHVHLLHCLSGGALYLNTYITFAPGNRLQHFSMTVGPHEGTYKTCGYDARFALVSTGETKAFYCRRFAMGTSFKITILGNDKIITLCEVQLFGKGMYTTIVHYN